MGRPRVFEPSVEPTPTGSQTSSPSRAFSRCSAPPRLESLFYRSFPDLFEPADLHLLPKQDPFAVRTPPESPAKTESVRSALFDDPNPELGDIREFMPEEVKNKALDAMNFVESRPWWEMESEESGPSPEEIAAEKEKKEEERVAKIQADALAFAARMATPEAAVADEEQPDEKPEWLKAELEAKAGEKAEEAAVVEAAAAAEAEAAAAEAPAPEEPSEHEEEPVRPPTPDPHLLRLDIQRMDLSMLRLPAPGASNKTLGLSHGFTGWGLARGVSPWGSVAPDFQPPSAKKALPTPPPTPTPIPSPPEIEAGDRIVDADGRQGTVVTRELRRSFTHQYQYEAIVEWDDGNEKDWQPMDKLMRFHETVAPAPVIIPTSPGGSASEKPSAGQQAWAAAKNDGYGKMAPGLSKLLGGK